MLAWGASVPTLGGVTPLWAMPTNAARCTARHCMSGSAHTEELCTQFWQHAWRGSHALGSCIHDRRVRGNYYRSLEPPRRQQANPGARTGSGHSAEPRAVGRHKFDDHPGRQLMVTTGHRLSAYTGGRHAKHAAITHRSISYIAAGTAKPDACLAEDHVFRPQGASHHARPLAGNPTPAITAPDGDSSLTHGCAWKGTSHRATAQSSVARHLVSPRNPTLHWSRKCMGVRGKTPATMRHHSQASPGNG